MGKLEIDELKKRIIDWHIATFPDATLESQLLKFEEEFKEWVDSATKKKKDYDEYMFEFADAFIVALVLSERFGSCVGGYFVGLANLRNRKDDLILYINKKMGINEKRKWKKVNGVYRHEP